MIDVFVPMITVSEANVSDHWTKKSKRHKLQQWKIFCALYNAKVKMDLPINILMIRRGKRKMDFDNLVSSLKHSRDEIANYFIPGLAKGRADDSSELNWHYGQLTTKNEVGVWIILW